MKEKTKKKPEWNGTTTTQSLLAGSMNILPVIYLRGGKAVTKAGQPASLAGGDPIEAARALALVGEIYLVDLDAEVESYYTDNL